MKDQPFKRNLQTDKTNPQENYRYPTYQHYYQHKGSKGKQQSSPRKVQVNTEKTLPVANEQSPHTPLLNKKSTKSSLKAELENLKVEVQRIMQRKQGILKSPIEKKLFTNIERNKSESQFAISPSKTKEEIEDNQSVSSETLLGQPLKKLDLKATTENYNHTQYMQLQNDLLKTELKNLKNKYINKKQQLNEKCEALQKKVAFLETSLANSEQSLAAEIATLKENLKEVEKEKSTELIPTSDKAREQSPSKQTATEHESEVVKDKIKKLYEELAKKSKVISQHQQQIEDFTNEMSKLKKELAFKEERIGTLSEEIEQLKTKNSSNLTLIAQKDTRISQILDELEEERSKQYQSNESEEADQNDNVNLLEEKLQLLKSEYESKIEKVKQEFEEVMEKKRTIEDQKQLLDEELKYERSDSKLKDEKIEHLNEKIKEALENNQSNEEKYLKMIEKAEKNHEQTLTLLHQDYQTKIMNLSSRRERSLRDQSVSQKGSKGRPPKEYKETTPVKEHEVRKWKLQYKQLKQKYELHIKREATKREELKDYYKNYREYKQKVEIYAHKIKLLEKELEKNLAILTTKEKDLLNKEIEIRRFKSDWKLEKNTFQEEITTLNQKCKALEAKYNEESQKVEQQIAYRKDVEKKVFSQEVSDEELKEVMNRMKKRLIEQDEKYSKHVKEIKNKESLNIRLKKELREVMESMQKKINEQTTQEITDLTQNYLKKEFDSFNSWKSKVEVQQKLLSDSNDALVSEIQSLKTTIYQKDEALNELQTELNNFAHSYNLKNIQMNQILDQRDLLIRNYEDQLEELNTIKNSIQNILHEQLSRKSQEITNLRMQIASQSMKPLEYKTFHSNFDDILKSHIEDNKKLRQDITKKTEQIFKLRDNYGSLRSQFQNLKSQIDINKLKALSEMKNMEVNYQVQTDKIKNELDMSQKKSNLLEQKFKLLIDENKKKDMFIQTYIVGKKLSQSDKDLVKDFIKKYQITVGSNDLAQRLANETQEIQRISNYNRILLKEISVLKEKVAQFEAIDEEKVSVFDSKFSKYSIHSQSDINEEQEDTESFDIKQKSETKLKKAQSMQVFTQIQHQI